MTVVYTTKDLFKVDADIIVNTVNTVGVMGKGVALTCKKRCPAMYEQYRLLCHNQQLAIGKLWLYRHSTPAILCFPTKIHWRDPSQLEWIESGLVKLVTVWPRLGYKSIAFPPLGCGNGGLDILDVFPIMESYLNKLEGEFIICAPGNHEKNKVSVVTDV